MLLISKFFLRNLLLVVALAFQTYLIYHLHQKIDKQNGPNMMETITSGSNSIQIEDNIAAENKNSLKPSSRLLEKRENVYFYDKKVMKTWQKKDSKFIGIVYDFDSEQLHKLVPDWKHPIANLQDSDLRIIGGLVQGYKTGGIIISDHCALETPVNNWYKILKDENLDPHNVLGSYDLVIGLSPAQFGHYQFVPWFFQTKKANSEIIVHALEDFNRNYKPAKKNYMKKIWSRAILDYISDEYENFTIDDAENPQSIVLSDLKILVLPLRAFYDAQGKFPRLLSKI